jgi:peptide/nickel transport system permease protein
MKTPSESAQMRRAEIAPAATVSPAWLIELRRTLVGIGKSPSTMFGLALIAVHVIIALTVPLWAPYSPIATNPAAILKEPGAQHLLGTDSLGRDIFSRVMYGGQFSLGLSIIAAVICVAIGGVLGMVAAYYRGWFDEALMRFVDAVLSVPTILALLLVVSLMGNGAVVIAIAAVVVYAPAVARVARAATLQVVELDYVTAAKGRGESGAAIILREILPNVLDVLLVELAMKASWILLLVSSLSFLGFGANPPTPDWGLMVAENRTLLSVLPWGTVAPIIALGTLIIGFNLAADGLAKIRGVDRAGAV